MSVETLDAPAVPQSRAAAPSQTGALFVVSVLSLFLELLLIRWLGTEIRIFAYLQNTVLIVCFLGLGMGCWVCRRPVSSRQALVPLFILVLLMAVPQTRAGLQLISELLGSCSDVGMWYQSAQATPLGTVLKTVFGLSLTFFLMVLLWAAFVPFGQVLGRLMDDHPNTVWAYSVNVSGSLAGIWLFVLFSAYELPPAGWFLATGALMLALRLMRPEGKSGLTDAVLLAGIVVLGAVAGSDTGVRETVWSPYQKLVLQDVNHDNPEAVGEFNIGVNNVGYQVIINLDAQHTASHPDRYPPALDGRSQYDIPTFLHPKPAKVLVVGAGSGNDAAGALRQGAGEVVAVEIDPAIIDFGKRFHPEKPYDSPRVRTVIDDARSFFATTDEKFDVITFGLLDAHTGTTMTNARLDHYVYTRESLERAKSLLAENGILVLSFGSQMPYVADRMVTSVREVFGQEPISFWVPITQYGWGGLVIIAGDLDTAKQRIASDPKLSAAIAGWQAAKPVVAPGNARVATDDWPFIHLEEPTIPLLYFLLAGMLAVLFALGLRRLEAPDLLTGWHRSHWHFFFLGAAFMLLEVQNITKASVVLGNTWQVNAVIISAILVLILLANLLSVSFPRLPGGLVYALLVGSCVALYFVDVSRFAFLPYLTKAVVVGGVLSLPMLFSGIIFIRSFAAVEGKDRALGANLLGALLGGALQSITFLAGIKVLLLIVAAFYIAAMFTRPSAARGPAPVPA
jgi:spermidine synthase